MPQHCAKSRVYSHTPGCVVCYPPRPQNTLRGPLLYMQSAVDRNLVIRLMTVCIRGKGFSARPSIIYWLAIQVCSSTESHWEHFWLCVWLPKMQTTSVGSWKNGPRETLLELSLWEKLRNRLSLCISQEEKDDAKVYIKRVDRQQLLRHLFNSQEAAVGRKGSGMNFSPFIWIL